MRGAYEGQTGRIFDIQKFSIHDGPGIRTIVFLKGCALRCRWCCNPESQSREVQTMNAEGKAKTVGEDVTAGAVLAEVLKDTPYFRRSGGGLTLSGGEALLQPAFAHALLWLAKNAGISTAMESTAFGSFATIRDQILPWLDVFLLDIKHMDDRKHRAFTGQSNESLLENAARIAETGQNLVIRTPVVPGFNDSEEEIGAIARFAATLPGVRQLHLLPLHQYGAHKYAQLGRSYPMSGVQPPTAARMETLRGIAAETGLTVQIGG